MGQRFAPFSGNYSDLSGAPLGVRQLSYAQKTIKPSDTISNTAAKTAFASSYLFLANSIGVGQVFEIEGFGQFNSLLALPGTVTCGVQLTSASSVVTSMASVSPFALGINASNIPFYFKVKMIMQTSGVNAIMRSSGLLFYHTSSLTIGSTTLVMPPLTNSIDTTQAQTLQAYAQFSVASANVNSQLSLMTVYSAQAVAASN